MTAAILSPAGQDKTLQSIGELLNTIRSEGIDAAVITPMHSSLDEWSWEPVTLPTSQMLQWNLENPLEALSVQVQASYDAETVLALVRQAYLTSRVVSGMAFAAMSGCRNAKGELSWLVDLEWELD